VLVVVVVVVCIVEWEAGGTMVMIRMAGWLPLWRRRGSDAARRKRSDAPCHKTSKALP
jgi:hypothetical protein